MIFVEYYDNSSIAMIIELIYFDFLYTIFLRSYYVQLLSVSHLKVSFDKFNS